MSAAPPPLAPGQLPPIPPNISSIAYPFIIGTLFSWLLFGILTVQVFIYIVAFPNDRKAFKYLVFGVYFLDTVQTALTAVDLWYWFGVGYGNLLHLTNPYISIFDTPLLGSVIQFIVQVFFCYRIWTLSKKAWVVAGIALLSLFQLISVIIVVSKSHMGGDINNNKEPIIAITLSCWLVGGAVVDFCIAASMTYLLLQGSSRRSQQSSTILNSIIRLTIESNAATTCVAIITVILYYARPDVTYYITPTYVLGKLYSNTLLCQFNNRLLLSMSPPTPQQSKDSGNRTPAATFHISTTTTTDLGHVESRTAILGESHKMERMDV